jgi:23S rRNA pseudouridine1911/1915/1917 synthase
MTSQEDIDLLVITEEEAGERLDKILAKRFHAIHSRTYFQELITQQLVLVNGEPVKKRLKLQAGDEVEVEFTLAPEIHLLPEAIPLSIIYEDEHLLAVNKQVGLVVHPGSGNWTGTFVNALLYYCQQLPVYKDPLRPGIVHRLDKDTSGVLVAAKTYWMHQKLVELFASRQVYKEYLAICVGHPGEVEIRAPIGRHPIHRQQMAIVPQGREALSVCKTLAWDGKLSVVQVVIATGRTHQIRVHLKYRGTPVLGDPVYGNERVNQYYKATHQFLHAAVLRFIHPLTQNQLEIKADVPEEMNQFIQKIMRNQR